jgi:hypothetical protein
LQKSLCKQFLVVKQKQVFCIQIFKHFHNIAQRPLTLFIRSVLKAVSKFVISILCQIAGCIIKSIQKNQKGCISCTLEFKIVVQMILNHIVDLNFEFDDSLDVHYNIYL